MKKLFFAGIILIVILAIWVLSNWQKSNLSDTESFENIAQKLQNIAPQNNKLPENSPYQEFATSDGNFKINYPANWLKIDSAEILKALTPPDWAGKYSLETLFLAQSFTSDGFTQLIVYRGNFDMEIEGIVEEIKKNNQEQGWTVEIIESEVEIGEASFEAEYSRQGSPDLYSKEKILTIGNQAYLVSFVFPKEKLADFAQEADLVMDSIIALDKNE